MVLQVAGGKYKSDRSRSVARMGRNPLEMFSPPPLKKCVGHNLQLLDIVKKFGTPSENSSTPWCPKLVT